MATNNDMTSGSAGVAADLMTKHMLLAWVKDGSRSAPELISACGKHDEVDRAIASHARAPAELLSTLSHSSDRATRARVAANPSTDGRHLPTGPAVPHGVPGQPGTGSADAGERGAVTRRARRIDDAVAAQRPLPAGVSDLGSRAGR